MEATTNNVANTILAQLGGSRFIAMTGAKNLLYGASELQMQIGRNAKRVTHVRIHLAADDTYTVDFYRVAKRGLKVDTLSAHSMIYCDQLQELFTRETGMHTSL